MIQFKQASPDPRIKRRLIGVPRNLAKLASLARQKFEGALRSTKHPTNESSADSSFSSADDESSAYVRRALWNRSQVEQSNGRRTVCNDWRKELAQQRRPGDEVKIGQRGIRTPNIMCMEGVATVMMMLMRGAMSKSFFLPLTPVWFI